MPEAEIYVNGEHVGNGIDGLFAALTKMVGGTVTKAEEIAKEFHHSYEVLAPEFNYETRLESRVPWEDLPKNNRELMIAVVEDLINRHIIPIQV